VSYGQGVYFAADASHSLQDFLTKRSSGKRYIILTKALTGDFVKGNPKLRLPPSKNSTNDTTEAKAVYDSTVDDESNPAEYVIYNDTQAYPEYLITFTI